MLRKYVVISVLFITLFSFNCLNINAYDFIEKGNESLVNDMIVEIYDSKEQYEDLAGSYEEVEPKIQMGTNSSYWWPIGSEQTVEVDGKIYAKDAPITTYITSPYGYRHDPFGRGTKLHGGVDIAGGLGNGIINVIAAKDGIVVYPTANVSNDCPSSTSLSNCGGSYGNYVIIQHSDGNYTLYAHLYEHSITVVAGDSVEQGQVIAKMGSSGSSTGTHLHFEVRAGENSLQSRVDPLNYVSLENPRVMASVGTDSELVSWINSWEGHTQIVGDYYLVDNIGDGVRTVGAGVTLENNPEKFLQYGIDIDDYPEGSKISIEIVDQIKFEIINDKRTYVEGVLANNSLTLQENEIQALISQVYNIGNINGFVSAYNKYGNTQDLYDNWFFRAIRKGSKFEKGLTRRRNAEWSLFHLGEYIYNG